MWAQIRYVVGIDQRVCTNEGTSMDMTSKYTHIPNCLRVEVSFLFVSTNIAKLLTSILR